MKKNRILALIVSAALTLSLTACAENSEIPLDSANSTSNGTSTSSSRSASSSSSMSTSTSTSSTSVASSTDSTSSSPESKPEESSKPEQSSSKPEQSSSKPEQSSSKPVQSSTKPVQSSSKPAQSSSKPVQSSSKPVTPQKPAGVDWDSIPYADELDFEVSTLDDGSGVEIIGYLGTNKIVKVPKTINGLPVKKADKLIEVSYRGLGWGAVWAYCTAVKLPDTVEKFTYRRCPFLTGFNIPKSAKVVGEYAFAGCESITSVVIPEGIESIGVEAFAQSLKLKSVIIPKTVKSIGSRAFNQCYALESVNIPESVESICSNSFLRCPSLKSLTIPASVTEIQRGLFITNDSSSSDKPKLSELNISGSLTITPCEENKLDGIRLSYCSDLKNADFLKKITVTPGYSKAYAKFEYCSSLTEITIPENIAEVYLDGCTSLKKVTLPNSTRKFHFQDPPREVQIVFKGKTYRSNQLADLQKSINKNI